VATRAYEAGGRPLTTARRRLSAALWRRPWLRAIALLLPPLGWLVVFYLAALAVLFVSAFWSIDSFTGKLVHVWTWTNFDTVFTEPTYRQIAFRTIWMAAAVTVTDALIAFPFAYFMARIAGPRLRTVLFVLVLSIIGGFQLFVEPYLLWSFGNSPGNGGLSVALLIYKTAFNNFNFGQASAMGVLLALVILVVSLIQFRLFGGRRFER